MESSPLPSLQAVASRSFRALTSDERRHLRAWQSSARSIGIDAVEDLTERPWPCPIAESVIGVFQGGSTAAQWLVIGHNGAWAVACCADGEVSRTLSSFAEALVMIYPGEGLDEAATRNNLMNRKRSR